MNSLLTGMGKLNLRPASMSRKRGSIYAHQKVSGAFARVGRNMGQAVSVLTDGKVQFSPRKIRVIANDKITANYLENVTFKLIPGKSICVVARNAKTADFLRDYTFELTENGDIRVISKKEA